MTKNDYIKTMFVQKLDTNYLRKKSVLLRGVKNLVRDITPITQNLLRLYGFVLSTINCYISQFKEFAKLKGVQILIERKDYATIIGQMSGEKLIGDDSDLLLTLKQQKESIIKDK